MIIRKRFPKKALLPLLPCLALFIFMVPSLSEARSKKKAARAPQKPLVSPALSLAEALDQLLDMAGGKVSVQIVSLDKGQVIYEKNPDRSLNPASNVKLVTAAAALRELGPDYAFKTEFFVSSPISPDGSIKNLWIKGYGDPLFVTEELENILGQFRNLGLKRITDALCVDDSYFDRYDRTAYISDAGEKIYNILTGPLSFNFNRLVTHPSKKSFPQGRDLPKDPALLTAETIRQMLEEEGISVGKGIRSEAAPLGARLIFTHHSPPLTEVLKGMGKFSNNFIAEQVLKSLGAIRYQPPGTVRKGLKVLENYLQSLRIAPGTYLLDTGSGLSKLNRLSAAQLVRVLIDQYHSPHREAWISSLSIGGIDGTLRKGYRNSPVKGKVLAKTGTLNDVDSLSGYLMERKNSDKGVAFSFLFNDSRLSHWKIDLLEESLLETIWRGRDP